MIRLGDHRTYTDTVMAVEQTQRETITNTEIHKYFYYINYKSITIDSKDATKRILVIHRKLTPRHWT